MHRPLLEVLQTYSLFECLQVIEKVDTAFRKWKACWESRPCQNTPQPLWINHWHV